MARPEGGSHKPHQVKLNLTHEEIGQMIGTSRETVQVEARALLHRREIESGLCEFPTTERGAREENGVARGPVNHIRAGGRVAARSDPPARRHARGITSRRAADGTFTTILCSILLFVTCAFSPEGVGIHPGR